MWEGLLQIGHEYLGCIVTLEGFWEPIYCNKIVEFTYSHETERKKKQILVPLRVTTWLMNCETDVLLIGQSLSAFYGARKVPVSSKNAQNGEGGTHKNFVETLIY